MSNLAEAMQRRESLTASGIDPDGDDDTVLGAFVYCHQHCRPHATGWCTVSLYDKTPLSATTPQDAAAETRSLGLWIFGEPRTCLGCDQECTLTDGWRGPDGSERCPTPHQRASYGRHHFGD